MAIVYDFDGTLADGNMQEHQFLPQIGIKPKDFWSDVKQQAKAHNADEILIYMKLMLDNAKRSETPVRRDDFKSYGTEIKLFDGVIEWFDRINKYAQKNYVCVEHYLVSSGNAEIFSGTPIFQKFKKVYASQFMFDENDVAIWPALAVNYTTKTQYLFRINKGALDLNDNNQINKFVTKHDRPVPFENMVYIGDGSTDIPCFRLVKEQGGLSVAVYKPRTKGARDKAIPYLEEGRVHCVVPAIYTENSELDNIIKANISIISARSKLSYLLSRNNKTETEPSVNTASHQLDQN